MRLIAFFLSFWMAVSSGSLATPRQFGHLSPSTFFQSSPRLQAWIHRDLKNRTGDRLSLEKLMDLSAAFKKLPPEEQIRFVTRFWESQRAGTVPLSVEPAAPPQEKLRHPIYAVAVNPTLDFNVEMAAAEKGGLAATAVYENVGGTTNIVAKTLAGFGDPVSLFGVMGRGPISTAYQNLLKQIPFQRTELTRFGSDIRVCPIFTGHTSEGSSFEIRLRAQITPLTYGELGGVEKDLAEKLFPSLQPGAFVVTGGRLPPGAGPSFFPKILRKAKAKGAKVIFDLHSTLDAIQITAVLAAQPYLVKTNVEEFAYLTKLNPDDIKANPLSAVAAAREIMDRNGIEVMVITLDKQGAVLVSADAAYRAVPPEIEFRSSVGAGDASVAGLAHSLAHGASFVEALRFAVAAGTASTAKPGTQVANLDETRRMAEKVVITPLDSRPIVIALGGNAFGDGDINLLGKDYWESFRPAVAKAAAEIANLVVAGEKVVITFGNGPQVGHELDADPERALYDHVLTTQNEMGGLLENEIGKALAARRAELLHLPGVVKVETHVLVDSADPGFRNYTKPIGLYTEKRALELAAILRKRSPKKTSDGREAPLDILKTSKGTRVLVPSPEPKLIDEINQIKNLVEEGKVVIACGGGSIPVDNHDRLREAVVDKDLASAVLATELNAKTFVILTESDGITQRFVGNSTSVYETELSVKEIGILLRGDPAKKQFPDGSIRPKMQGAASFAEKGNNVALIARLERLNDALLGKTGTRIVKVSTAVRTPPTQLFDPARLQAFDEAV